MPGEVVKSSTIANCFNKAFSLPKDNIVNDDIPNNKLNERVQ